MGIFSSPIITLSAFAFHLHGRREISARFLCSYKRCYTLEAFELLYFDFMFFSYFPFNLANRTIFALLSPIRSSPPLQSILHINWASDFVLLRANVNTHSIAIVIFIDDRGGNVRVWEGKKAKNVSNNIYAQ